MMVRVLGRLGDKGHLASCESASRSHKQDIDYIHVCEEMNTLDPDRIICMCLLSSL